MTGNWTFEWPKKKGLYWFYGWCFKDHQEKFSPEMSLVLVRGTAKGFCFVTNGHFLYKQEAYGVWQKADVPEPPGMVEVVEMKKNYKGEKEEVRYQKFKED